MAALRHDQVQDLWATAKEALGVGQEVRDYVDLTKLDRPDTIQLCE
jgi:hypothetical protein